MSIAITVSQGVRSDCGVLVQSVTLHDALSGHELGRLQMLTENTGRTELRSEDGSPYPIELTHADIIRLIALGGHAASDIAA